jgi:hypothetical protein
MYDFTAQAKLSMVLIGAFFATAVIVLGYVLVHAST